MTIVSGCIDRTEQTRSITLSNQVSRRTGERIGIFDGPRTRPLASVDSIILHQTGFWQTARGDDVTAYDRMIAHFVILPNGSVLQLRDLEARLNSASQDYAIDIEVVGCFNADNFDCETWRVYRAAGRARPRGCSNHAVTHSLGELPTLAQIEAGRRLILAIRDHERISPDQIRYILAHRQVTRISRENCPGPHVWYNLGHWAETYGRLSSARRHRDRPIPPSWTERRFALPPPCLQDAPSPPLRSRSPKRLCEGVYSSASRRPGILGAD